MGIYVNPGNQAFKRIDGSNYVDKTGMIQLINERIGRDDSLVCISRPRRFGKSYAAKMLAAYYDCSCDSHELFDKKRIARSKSYSAHLNRYNVIYLEITSFISEAKILRKPLIEVPGMIMEAIHDDLLRICPDLPKLRTVNDELLHCAERPDGKQFIFIIDEWDAIFHKSFITSSDQEKYLDFLKNLLKGQVYVEFAYMTGVLPIAKYSSGSELNMFLEYDIATSERFSEYFGFLDSEVDMLYHIYQQKTNRPKVTREDLRFWYNGYHTAGGRQVYNPRSIVCALTNNQLRNYWTSSGPYDEIFYYIKDNVEEIREDFILMITGERVNAKMQEYAATAKELNTKAQIYSAMVIYGLLTYEDGDVFIPNRELMEQFNQLLLSNEGLGYVYRLARESERMLRATLSHDTDTMTEILEFVHNTESPIFEYNNETELSAVVNLVYLSARDKYRVEREDKAGKGFVDFVFYPERRHADAIILELKIDSTPEDAIQQIKNKNYALCFRGKLGEEPRYSGKILAVGISYNKKSKRHFCKIESL